MYELLVEEAKRVEVNMGGLVSIAVHILTLFPRLSTEKRTRELRAGELWSFLVYGGIEEVAYPAD